MKKKKTVHTTEEMIDYIVKVAKMLEATSQSKEFAKAIKNELGIEPTCKIIWNTLTDNIEFTGDKDHSSYPIYLPGAAWQQRKEVDGGTGKGLDVRSFALLFSSILTNLKIKHSYRFISVREGKDYHHMYVVAYDGKREIILDPLLKEFNKECKSKKQTDREII